MEDQPIPEEKTKEIDAYFDRHCAMPGGVILVTVDSVDDNIEVATGIFTSLPRAKAFVKRKLRKGMMCDFRAHMIDNPDFLESPSGAFH